VVQVDQRLFEKLPPHDLAAEGVTLRTMWGSEFTLYWRA
jgi:phage terminase large subunit-like protein